MTIVSISGTVSRAEGQTKREKRIMRTADEMGKILDVSGRLVRRLAKQGKIPYTHVGPRALRFDEQEVLQKLKRQPREEPEKRQ